MCLSKGNLLLAKYFVPNFDDCLLSAKVVMLAICTVLFPVVLTYGSVHCL